MGTRCDKGGCKMNREKGNNYTFHSFFLSKIKYQIIHCIKNVRVLNIYSFTLLDQQSIKFSRLINHRRITYQKKKDIKSDRLKRQNK